MCGIAGILNLENKKYRKLDSHLRSMNRIQAHRGPDDEGVWLHKSGHIGFGHRRLSIIDLTMGTQPMIDDGGNVICYNGEIYNYVELRNELDDFNFKTLSDTEVILKAYRKWGKECLGRLRGMFAFAIWDESKSELFCARDRFGIKPFYYTIVKDNFYFASEVKTLLPFIPTIETDRQALGEYLTFQFCLDGKTLFEGIKELPAAHYIVVKDGELTKKRYWEIYYNLDFTKPKEFFTERLRSLIEDSVKIHTRSDVPVGAYISGGIDSGIVASVAVNFLKEYEFKGFTGKFSYGELYDESKYAHILAKSKNIMLHEMEITSGDFIRTIEKIIYHLDYPVAGPGAFPQYHVSNLASKYRKVVLSGLGGDEIFGGYARYLIAYFEQCIKGAIDNTLKNGNFIVTYESIIPNLIALENYKPLLQEFWKDGLFDDLDKRYFRLINRANSMDSEINWKELGDYSPFDAFSKIFNGSNIGKESYFDKMTHFDFKTLLPALLHVEDRMSMAHGLESRVPFLDHPIVEFAATIPSNIKFKDGTMKKMLLDTMGGILPDDILQRKDKMGFPVPINEWLGGEIKNFVLDIFNSQRAKKRRYFNSGEIIKNLMKESKFGRKIWGLLCLELWFREFHDKNYEIKKKIG